LYNANGNEKEWATRFILINVQGFSKIVNSFRSMQIADQESDEKNKWSFSKVEVYNGSLHEWLLHWDGKWVYGVEEEWCYTFDMAIV
jgi:hypothetical protein